MAQITTWPIPSGPSGLAMRQQVNLITEALRTSNSGATAPTPTVAGMLWYDTSVTPGIQKIRNSANDGWFVLLADNSDESTQLSQLAGRNLIINGSGRINQRGYVSGTATGAANQFTLDRWFVVTSGQNLTFTGTGAGRTMTAPAGGAAQVIESVNIVSGTYTINWAGTATCTVGGVSRAKGDTFTLTGNTNATVVFFNGTFTNVQLELGTVATAFERMDIGLCLARCERYYSEAEAYGWGYGVSGGARRTATVYFQTMRATPSVTFIAAAGANVSGQSVGTSSNSHIGVNTTVGGAGEYSFSANLALSAELTA